MKKLIGPVTAAIVLSFSLLCALPSLAMENQYTEDFSTTLFMDAAHTTANWDTAAGELSLFPFHQTIIGNYDTPGYAYAVTVSGDYAFVADYASGLKIIDISDPANPTLLGTYDTPGDALDVTVSGDYAFVADKVFGLQIIHISDPTNPILLGNYDTPDMAYGVTVSGDYAFVADYRTGLQVFDISDPVNPALLGTCDTPGGALDVMVSGDNAFVADYDFGLQVIDISDPTNPTIIGTCDTPGYAQSITVAGDCVYMTDYYSGLQVIDISRPTRPKLIGTCDTPDRASDVVVTGDYAYVADYGSGLRIIDISDPTNPTLLEGCDTPGRAIGVVVAGDRAFVADHASGLQVITISEPISPTLIGNFDTVVNAWCATVTGDYAFVTDIAGLQIIDISDPANPTLLGTYDTPGGAIDVTVTGDYAFVADKSFGLQVIDISDPTNPTLLGNYNPSGNAYDVTVSGDYAFVADSDFGLQVIDISDPTNPTLLGTCDIHAHGLTVAGDYAFVADYGTGLQVINISDPTSPTLVGTCDTPVNALDVAVSGDYAFVADQSFGLQVIDISDPTMPTFLGNYNPSGDAYGVTVSGDYAFVAVRDGGIRVVDISDPTNPTLLELYNTPGYAYYVTVSGDYAFVADSDFGLQVIQVFQRGSILEGNIGRSLAVDAGNDTILRARLATTQADSVGWELSADGGTNWQGILPGTGWDEAIVPGADLLWRSTLFLAPPSDSPVVSDLSIEWLNDFALIAAVSDIPNDQGKQVRVEWVRSGHDFIGDASQIVEYAIYRQIDPNLAVFSKQVAPMSFDDLSPVARENAMMMASEWDFVVAVPVLVEDNYSVVVPTLADSTISDGQHQTTFRVTALTATPGVFFHSPPDSGYSIDNLAPAVPTSFAVDYSAVGGNQLSWDPCPDADFQYFNIYRSNDPDFIPSPSDLAHSATGTNWTDPEYFGWDVYYKVSALDFAGNESDPASAETVTAVPGSVFPQTFGLYPNAPNPFNPITTIRYDVPASGGTVTLRIYDVSGTLVRTLLDGPQTAGQESVTWNGKDSRGRSVASGVYFYRLQAPGYEKTLKMILVQ